MQNEINLNGHSEVLRKKSEKEFHDNLLRKRQSRQAQEKFYDKRITNIALEYAYLQMGSLKGKRILYYGCGVNKAPLLNFVSNGAYVISIDLSSEAIKAMKEFISEEGINKEAEALEMDAEKLSFDNDTFDLVFGTAILHHLDVKRASAEISRVLKMGGKAIFIEPLGMNPLINFYRFLTPADRTKGEHPFKKNDIEALKENFSTYRQQNFFFLALFAFFWKFLKSDIFFVYSFKILMALDNALFKIAPFLERYCWVTVIILEK